jgi:hypothetical protein
LQQLDAVAVDGTPLVQQLHAAIPALTSVQNDIGPFAAAAKPALASLSTTLKQATGVIHNTTPVVTTLRNYVDASLPSTKLFAKLASNLQQHGFVENFLSITYYIAAALARFDGTSHMLSILLIGANNGACGSFATKPVPGCSAHYGSNPPYTPVRGVAAGAAAAARASRRASDCQSGPRLCARGTAGRQPRPAQASAHQAPARNTPAAAALSSAAPSAPSGSSNTSAPPPGNSNPGQQAGQTLQSLVQYLLK